jgi:uncharacterized protein (TIGR03790 family)
VHALDARDLAVVVNVDDPLSVATAEYYAEQRALPPAQVIDVHLGAPRAVLSPGDFDAVWREITAHTPPHVQAYALAWTLPYRVGCMSITSAFAFGYAERYCAGGCAPTAPNPLFDQASRRPYDDFRVRPAMLLAARTLANAQRLIDRGRMSDGTHPSGTAYLVTTADLARSTRAPLYAAARAAFGARLPVDLVTADGIRNRYDVMFYFTGTTRVPDLETLGFLPGAIADHLTSAGGRLDGTRQMNVLSWLEAGATGSYGTVVEPCNFPQKFPVPGLVMKHYLAGETLLEAYWKSVVWPGQGLFVGEPLAAPFAPTPAH